MTRTTVYASIEMNDPQGSEVADVFQSTDDPDKPALTIEFGGYGTMSKIEIPPGEYIDVYINGNVRESVSDEWERFDVNVNGEKAVMGELIRLTSNAAKVNVGGYWFDIPPGQSLKFDVRGNEVDS